MYIHLDRRIRKVIQQQVGRALSPILADGPQPTEVSFSTVTQAHLAHAAGQPPLVLLLDTDDNEIGLTGRLSSGFIDLGANPSASGLVVYLSATRNLEYRVYSFAGITDKTFPHSFDGRPIVDVIDSEGNLIDVPVQITGNQIRVLSSEPITGSVIGLWGKNDLLVKEFPFTNLTEGTFVHGFTMRPLIQVTDTAGHKLSLQTSVTDSQVRLTASEPVSGILSVVSYNQSSHECSC